MARNFHEADHPIPELPREIIFSHILPRLPPKSLMRFRCVSKSWSSLIRSPFFVTAYWNYNKGSSTSNLVFQYVDGFFSIKLDQQGNPTPVPDILNGGTPLYYYPDYASINGLVFLSCTSQDLSEPVFIFNPTIKESIKISDPIPTFRTSFRRREIVSGYHFGFSPRTNEYKVLHVGLFYGKEDIIFHIFTLGKNHSWRPLQVDHGELGCDSSKFLKRAGSVCLHGAIHWIDESEKSIVVFDVGDETFIRTIPLPEDYSADGDIVEVGGCVGLFVDESVEQNKMVLWILDYENHEWVKETLNFMLTVRLLGRREWRIQALGTIHTGELALVFYVLGLSPGYGDWPPELHLYDMKTKARRVLQIEFPSWAYARDADIPIKLLTSYKESIVPLK